VEKGFRPSGAGRSFHFLHRKKSQPEGSVLRISVYEGRKQRRLLLEGKLIAPWATELRTACEKAKTDLDGRELVVEMNNLSAISQEGENVLLDLLSEGIKFRCHGVFTKLILKQLARRARANVQGAKEKQ
jgi:hypothetical protein